MIRIVRSRANTFTHGGRWVLVLCLLVLSLSGTFARQTPVVHATGTSGTFSSSTNALTTTDNSSGGQGVQANNKITVSPGALGGTITSLIVSINDLSITGPDILSDASLLLKGPNNVALVLMETSCNTDRYRYHVHVRRHCVTSRVFRLLGA